MPRTIGTPNLTETKHKPLVFKKWLRWHGKMRCQEITVGTRQCTSEAGANILFGSLENALAFCNKHLSVYDPESYDIVPLEARLKPGERRRDGSEYTSLDLRHWPAGRRYPRRAYAAYEDAMAYQEGLRR